MHRVRSLAAAGILTILLGQPAAAPGALPTGCTASGSTVVCTYTTGTAAFVVPSGVSTIHTVAIGGAGGGGTGGLGAVVSGDLSVTAGQILYAVVGANGLVASPGTPVTPGGGGNGGLPIFCITEPSLCAGGGAATAGDTGGDGGGASDLRTAAGDLTSRLLVAAGGGGGGSVALPAGARPAGGAAGGNGGAAGGPSSSLAGGGGGGGAGASGGTAGPVSTNFCISRCVPGSAGQVGSLGVGGDGGTAGEFLEQSTIAFAGPGGGGGGGLYGGGGGGGGSGGDPGGGGGGGSDLVPANGQQSLDSTHRGPQVQITYTVTHTPTISAVRFRGNPRNPTIVVNGSGFGDRPTPHPARGTSFLGRCRPISGRTGKDYGTALWIGDFSQSWSAGNTAASDCIGLIVVKYTATEVRFRLGSYYRRHYRRRVGTGAGTYELAPGDLAVVVVRGTPVVAHVDYH